MRVGLGYVHASASQARRRSPAARRSASSSSKELSRGARRGGRSTSSTSPRRGCTSTTSAKLLDLLHELVDGGNTVVVIEHNLDVIKTADWILDFGPEGGDGGGEIVARGTPEDVAKIPASWTGRYLAEVLDRHEERRKARVKQTVKAKAKPKAAA